MFQIGSVQIDIVSLIFTMANIVLIVLWVAIIVFIVRYLKAKKG